MTRPAAKGKTLWPALVAAAALLLTAPQALASRTASSRADLLTSPALDQVPATAHALAPAYVPQGFPLHLDADPHPAAFALFDDLTPTPASERLEPEKLASGVESWVLTPNLQRLQIFVTDSRWCREFLGPVDSPNLYQAFGLDPQNNTDPLGLSAVPCSERPDLRGCVGPMPVPAPSLPTRLPATSAADWINPDTADQIRRGVKIPSMSAGPPARGQLDTIRRGVRSGIGRWGAKTATIVSGVYTAQENEIYGRRNELLPIPNPFPSEDEDQETIAQGTEMLIDVGLLAKTLAVSSPVAVDSLDIGIPWGQGVGRQGFAWEDYLASIRSSSNRLPPGFKTFDFYDEASGLATSAKTLDTSTAARLADPSQIYYSLKGNVDTVADFSGYQLGGRRLLPEMITSRELQVAIPPTTTQAQMQQVARAIEYGRTRNVAVVVTTAR